MKPTALSLLSRVLEPGIFSEEADRKLSPALFQLQTFVPSLLWCWNGLESVLMMRVLFPFHPTGVWTSPPLLPLSQDPSLPTLPYTPLLLPITSKSFLFSSFEPMLTFSMHTEIAAQFLVCDRKGTQGLGSFRASFVPGTAQGTLHRSAYTHTLTLTHTLTHTNNTHPYSHSHSLHTHTHIIFHPQHSSRFAEEAMGG